MEPQSDPSEETHYDFVIIGGGSAGCALANRLSTDDSNRVLLLEAGRPDYIWDPFIHMPAGFSFPIGSRFYDWMYLTEPESGLNGRRVYHARGKVLGGSSSINGMIFQRGNPLDMERWAAAEGMSSWDYAHTLPYFKRLESCLAGEDEWRGGGGPLKLERGPAVGPLFDAFFDAAVQAGYELTTDVNGYRQEGFASFDRNVYRGRRLSAARAYLSPVLNRPNLEVRTRAHTTRLLVEGKKVVGVETVERRPFGRHLRHHRYKADTVVCCAGAINTPQLLQLSGIGPQSVLARAEVPVLVDLPGVGENLQDHLEVYVQYASKLPITQQPNLSRLRRPWIGLQWLFRRGAAATNHFEAGGFLRSREGLEWPNVMLHFLPLAVRYDGVVADTKHGYQVHVGPMHARSRGSVTLRSRDPFDKPSIRFNYLDNELDRQDWVDAIRAARKILSQPAFEEIAGKELSPGLDIETDRAILDWVKSDAETALHPCGTAKMGCDSMSVVDPKTMEVHGMSGLRVVDASVLPSITNGNIYAPTMMIAEKAADLILGNTPLSPLTPGYYSK
ncbi:MAG: choline dehydrogenase [Acidimicrobiales bacterium]|nr:choline dehydrogenase [Acidimicrobiales bacterium]